MTEKGESSKPSELEEQTRRLTEQSFMKGPSRSNSFRTVPFSNFEFVSDFEFRISNFLPVCIVVAALLSACPLAKPPEHEEVVRQALPTPDSLTSPPTLYGAGTLVVRKGWKGGLLP
jgi:hypothetical protein